MKSKIPTLLAIFILILVLAAILFGVNEIQGFKSKANSNFAPIDLRITNIKDTSATVSWLTDTPTIGIVQYNNTVSSPSNLSTAHFINLVNLSPDTSYSFTINSGGQIFDNNSSNWQFQTLASLSPVTGVVISGKILNGNLPADNTILYVTANNTVYGTLVSLSGSWVLTLPDLPDSTSLDILAENSPSLISSAKINLNEANPTPPITLGKSYDFRNDVQQTQVNTPKVPIDLP